MNRQLIIYPLSLVAIACLFMQCKNKFDEKKYCVKAPSDCKTVQEAKDYFAFNEGSWWVYEEETSGERDSCYVTYGSNNTSSSYFVTEIYSSYQDYSYNYYADYIENNICSENLPVLSRCLYVDREKGKPGEYVGHGYCFFVNYRKGDNVSINSGGGINDCPNNSLIYEDIFSSYELGNLTFSKTIKVHELCSYIEGEQPTNHYYSKGVGIIRKELIDSNKVWNLVNYHIEP